MFSALQQNQSQVDRSSFGAGLRIPLLFFFIVSHKIIVGRIDAFVCYVPSGAVLSGIHRKIGIIFDRNYTANIRLPGMGTHGSHEHLKSFCSPLPLLLQPSIATTPAASLLFHERGVVVEDPRSSTDTSIAGFRVDLLEAPEVYDTM